MEQNAFARVAFHPYAEPGGQGRTLLVHPLQEGKELEVEEVVLRTQGYLLECHLPPILKENQ